MLTSLPDTAGAAPVWIDLCDPTPEEAALVRERYAIEVPDLHALREIESSSRLRAESDALVMTAPLLSKVEGEERWQFVPTGFVLRHDFLLTVRYERIRAFDAVMPLFAHPAAVPATPVTVLARLLEEVVDRAADQLEAVSEVTTSVSRTVFYNDIDRGGLSQETAILRRSIIKLGRASDRASRVRYMFLSVGRMATFVADRCETGIEERTRARFLSVVHDIASLDEFEVSLSGRIQFLLDAATGLIGIRQNDVVKVLTVASVVGIPPVLVVGVYGMNFRFMPELSWPWGYPFALGLCVLSAVVPYVVFKWKKWV